jgi:hypothetical protein
MTDLGTSALNQLQTRLSNITKLSSRDLLQAVSDDLSQGRELSECILTKLIRQATLGRSDLESLAVRVQTKMASVLSSDPTLYLNYSRVSVCIASELRRKSIAISLAA